jgi:predicted Fe-Mo cluster-binding NifX family protein
MAKIAMTFSVPDLDAPLAEHFGKAKWLLFVSSPSECEVVRNEWINGHGVALELSRRGCTDVIVRHMGPGAFDHLTAAGIRVWQAAPESTGRGQLRYLDARALTRFEPDRERSHHRGHEGRGHGPGGVAH